MVSQEVFRSKCISQSDVEVTEAWQEVSITGGKRSILHVHLTVYDGVFDVYLDWSALHYGE